MAKPTPPTAQTFFPSSPYKTNIQKILSDIVAGSNREKIISEASALGPTMGGDDRIALMGMVYSQLEHQR